MGREHGRILVVDDSHSIVRTVEKLLQREGHETEAALSGRVALERLDESDFDLVLLDVIMPEMDGFAVLERIRRDYSPLQLPVIMLTALDDPTAMVRAFETGANDYAAKPIDNEVVVARVRMQLYLRELTRLKERFLGIASHDLKKPVMLIRDIAETLVDECYEGYTIKPEDIESLQLLVRSSHYMSSIIQDFLDLQALEDGRLTLQYADTEINPLLRRQMEGSHVAAKKKGLSLTCDLQEGLPTIRCDGRRVAQVVDNLVGNAIKFSRPGDAIKVRSRLSGDSIRIEVRDTGPGVPEKELGKLFTRFARLSPKPTAGEQSSGFGLSICRQLIEMHGGRIGAEPNPGGGMVFWFELPVSATEAGPVTPRSHS